MMKNKKRNYKLRRRVKRTIASVTMVMAVVVAAIPVENLGTMQASGIAEDKNLQKEAEDYMNAYFAQAPDSKERENYTSANQEKDYPKPDKDEDIKTVQHIEDTTFINAYEVYMNKDKPQNAMIARSVFASNRDSFDIYETEYYDYVQMGYGGNGDYINVVNDTFGGETYTLKYTSNTDTKSHGDVTLKDADGKDITLKFESVTINTVPTEADDDGKVENGPNTGTNIPFPDDSKINTYVIHDTSTRIIAGDMLAAYAPKSLEKHLSNISDYNARVKTYTDILDEINAKPDETLTTDDVARWNTAVSSIKELGDPGESYTTFSMTYSEIVSANEMDEDGNNLPDIIDFTICQRLKSNDKGDLKWYDLKHLVNEEGKDVYVPQKHEGESTMNGQVVDDQNYLASGSVTIRGIGTDAFNPTVGHSAVDNDNGQIQKLTIPGTVMFIGERAFANSVFLADVTIDDSNCTVLSDMAFSDCTSLSSVKFTGALSSLATVGHKTFFNTALKSIEFPQYVGRIGAGCLWFSDIESMTMVGLKNGRMVIDPYAFFGCKSLTEVNFIGEDTDFEIGRAAFALSVTQGGGAITDFVFPSSMTQIVYDKNDEDKYDYILAGRSDLNSVTFPGRLGSGGVNGMIPDHTLAGCIKLAYVKFPDDANNAEFRPLKLFAEVTDNDQFYVEGPELGNNNTKAMPRQLTWKAVPGYTTPDGGPGVVPYKFTDRNGVEHMEIGVGQEHREDYIATIDVVDESTAILSGYEENNESQYNIAVEIPAKVGQYTIVEIANNCFGEKVKNKIYKVVVADGTVKKIDASAFEGCKNLQWVELGNSINFIGQNAFANCGSLENVVFSQTGLTTLYGDDDEYWASAVEIEENAFKTGSSFLTFHGAVNPGYAPYKLAMSEDSISMTGTSMQICYKTDAPTNLTIMRDNATGRTTLIDYPHYEEIDLINESLVKKWSDMAQNSAYSITDKFEEINGLRTTNNYDGNPFFQTENFNEEDIVLNALKITLPKGIESIDAKGFYSNSANANDVAYLTRTYTPETVKVDGNKIIEVAINGSNDAARNINFSFDGVGSYTNYDNVKNIYSEHDYIADGDLDELGLEPGLFNGFMAESELSSTVAKLITPSDTQGGIIWRSYGGHDYVENSIVGNDNLTQIDLKSVKELPDYAFMSCENLLTTSYSADMAKIGALPYRGCKSLTNIDIPSNNNYVKFGNMILYTNEENAAGLKIVECLEGRGNSETNNSPKSVKEANGDTYLSQVSEIAPEAFSYCDSIDTVDLSTTSIGVLPEKCFYKAESLKEVILPDTINVIGAEAFLDTAQSIEVTIPNAQCAIGETAFDFSDPKRFVRLRGPQYDSTGTKNSAIYNYYLKMEAVYGNQIEFVGEDKHKVTFIDYDTSLIVDPQVQNPQYVDDGADAQLVTPPSRTGYEFSEWKCILADGTQFNGAEPWKNVKQDRIIQAVYTPKPDIIEPDGNDYTLTIENGTANGTAGEIKAKGGDKITIIADTKTDGSTFQYWSVEPTTYSYLFTDGVGVSSTTFIMPNENVKITANFSKGTGGDKPGGDKPGDDDNKKKYKLTVNYGSGTGEYKSGETVTISAFAPDSSSKVFSKWTSNSTSLGFASATSSTTTIVMPESDVTVTANYKTRVGDDDDDDDDDDDRTPSRRPGSSTTTTTVTNKPSSSTTTTTGTSGTVTNPTGTVDNNNGNKIFITKNGVSNKDVASITVDGSTDNFIVRITESAEATAAVEESLINKYGSLDGLAYFPMDISLYDSTGQNKITDTYGLNITVTMPIPDVLIQYGGNARVAACDNGNLQQLTPRFTTIDGIACISFVPPHFSPYVIYVDTNNLIAGQTLDQTPSTGDPIHPKWFLATGMACLSIILFATSDSRKKKNFKTA